MMSAMFVVAAAKAQTPDAPTPKLTENTREEIFGMLELMGAEAWRFDLSAFSDAEYRFNPYFDEYVAGEKVEKEDELRYTLPSNWRQRFQDPDDWNKFIAEKNPKLSADGQKFLSFENMGMFIAPKNDSTKMVQISFYGGGALSAPLKLRPLRNTEEAPRYSYDCRPFIIKPLEAEKQRVPLLLVGSYWWDEKFGVHRFCGVNEFAPDMTDEELKFIPHYYVIGVEIEKVGK